MTKEVLYLIATLDLLAQFFKMDHNKVALWMTIKNPLLGEVKPTRFWYLGRGHKVYNCIVNCLDGNMA